MVGIAAGVLTRVLRSFFLKQSGHLFTYTSAIIVPATTDLPLHHPPLAHGIRGNAASNAANLSIHEQRTDEGVR